LSKVVPAFFDKIYSESFEKDPQTLHEQEKGATQVQALPFHAIVIIRGMVTAIGVICSLKELPSHIPLDRLSTHSLENFSVFSGGSFMIVTSLTKCSLALPKAQFSKSLTTLDLSMEELIWEVWWREMKPSAKVMSFPVLRLNFH
jgi:hypothetical protein